jgi:hypothetical protein
MGLLLMKCTNVQFTELKVKNWNDDLRINEEDFAKQE